MNNPEWEKATHDIEFGRSNKCCPCPDCQASSTCECPHKNEWETTLRLAKIGEAWESNSSLEKWFPLSAQELDKLLAQRNALLVALQTMLNAADGFDSLQDDDSRAEAYADELKALFAAKEQARNAIALAQGGGK